MQPLVTEANIDYTEVIRRIGDSGGNEYFYFLRCPNCSFIFLIDSEVDTAFMDASELLCQVSFCHVGDTVACLRCKQPLAAEQIWSALRGETGTELWHVSREALRASAWSWAIKENSRPESHG